MPGPEAIKPNGVVGATNVERRRSPRYLLDVALVVRGETAEMKPFEELTFTISVSTHGALVVLATKVVVGQKLLFRNPETQFETEGRVARLGSPYGGLAQVGIEFPTAASELWTVSAAPKH